MATFHEYLELFEYFGRGGLPRLEREEFDALHEELGRLVALERGCTPDELARVAELKQVLLRDRPRLSELKRRG